MARTRSLRTLASVPHVPSEPSLRALEHVAAHAALVASDGTVVDTNRAWRLFGELNGGSGRSAGTNYLEICRAAAIAGDTDAAIVLRGLEETLRGERAQFEHEYCCPSPTEPRWFLMQATPAAVDGQPGVLVMHHNTTARNRLAGELASDSEYEARTGLPSGPAGRRFLLEALTQCAHTGTSLGVVTITLDRFADKTRTLGRPSVNSLLVQVIERIRQTVGVDDYVFDAGQDRFVVIHRDTGPAVTEARASSLASAIEHPYQVGALTVTVDCSIGFAVGGPGDSADALLDAAFVANLHTHGDVPLHAASGSQPQDIRISPTLPTYTDPQTAVNALVRARTRVIEQRMGELFREVDHVVAVVDRDLVITYVTPSVESIIGVPPSRVIGRSALEFVHPDDAERFRTQLARAKADPDARPIVEYRASNDGASWRWNEMTVQNLLTDPAIGGLVLNVRDVTARREAEESLKFQARLLDSVGQPVVAVTPNGVITYWNRAATDLFGPEASDAIGRIVSDVIETVGTWGVSSDPTCTRTAMSAGTQSTRQLRMRRHDGQVFPAFVTDTPVLGDDNDLLGVISVTTDLSDRTRFEETQARLSAISTASPDAIVAVDLDGIVTVWNDSATALYGLGSNESIGRRLTDLEAPLVVELGLSQQLAGPTADRWGRCVRTCRSDQPGGVRHIEQHRTPIRDDAGRQFGTALIAREITEQVELTRALERDRTRLANAQRDAHVGSFELDRTTGEVSWSDELYEILGIAKDIPPSSAAYQARVHPDDRARVAAARVAAVANPMPAEIAHRIVRPDGSYRWVIARSGADITPDSDIITGSIIDVTDLKRSELRLMHQARHDHLTDLPNRAWLIDLLTDATSRSTKFGVPLTVALLDLDQFKSINDSMGHEAGDRILVAVASRIRNAVDHSDIVARFGGDEFVVIRTGVPGTPPDPNALGEQLRDALAAPVTVDGRRYRLTTSIGLTVASGSCTADSLLRDADVAMYDAKARGKDRHVLFDDELRTKVDRRLRLEQDLRTAVEDGHISLAFQPVLELAHLDVVGFETLVRWRHPELGEVSPEEFITIAEEGGQIFRLGEWVLRGAVEQLATWRREGVCREYVWIAVNLSARQLGIPRLAERTAAILDEFGLPPERLHLEVTESVLMDGVAVTLDPTRSLHELGVSISIDDFGTGYSSLSYLKKLHVDTLKIDRSFITGLGTDPSDTSIVTTVLGLARGLGMNVVAEGVENEVQLAALRDLGCDFGQGFLWSTPVPADVAARWLVDRERFG
jgi:diguanylate cyclase (GGDEF)-like protein/PAS domain S-box-containing protein